MRLSQPNMDILYFPSLKYVKKILAIASTSLTERKDLSCHVTIWKNMQDRYIYIKHHFNQILIPIAVEVTKDNNSILISSQISNNFSNQIRNKLIEQSNIQPNLAKIGS